jgi:mono/diheme cytochrome c family protein
MHKVIIALFLLGFGHLSFGDGVALAQSGDAQAGKALWDGQGTQCRNCHGTTGQGAFGPDLAGRKLSLAQFTHAIRRPWGVMPAFVESQLSDADIANLFAWFDSMPAAAQPGKWRYEVPANAARGQVVAITSGCAQCHGPVLAGPRAAMGAIDMDFDWFKSLVYSHTTAYPQLAARFEERPRRMRMGNFSPTRMWEPQLREIYDWARELGVRARIEARLGKGEPADKGVTYKLTVENASLPNIGLAVEDPVVRLIIPKDAEVVAATGVGYQGVRMDEQAKGNVAIWQVPRMAATDHQSFSITLSKAATAADNLRGEVRWTKPAVKTGPFDTQTIAPAPM